MGLFSRFRKPKSINDLRYLQGKTDRHSHILYGVDDGIRTLENSLAALAYMEEQGVTDLCCTPHIMEDTPNTTAFLKERFAELQSAYKGSIKLHLAAEYMLDNLFEQRLHNRDLMTMDDDIVLVETSTWTPPVNFHDVMEEMKKAGYRPMLAHPERYRYLKQAGYEKLKEMGILFQLNLPSIVGFYGQTANNKALWLLEKGYYDGIGSDCHRLQTTKEQFERKALDQDAIRLLG